MVFGHTGLKLMVGWLVDRKGGHLAYPFQCLGRLGCWWIWVLERVVDKAGSAWRSS